MEYDAETMTGLMPQILALTAPPGSRDNKSQLALSSTYTSKGCADSSALAAHPYFKRPGKGHNRDSCDSCGEGGDLICCDICPASFHLTCHDPPLDEDSIPVGDWLCHQCKVGKIADCATPASYSMLSKFSKALLKQSCEAGATNKMEVPKGPLGTLVKAATCINPKQFALPFQMSTPNIFPGESKDSNKKNATKKSHGRKKSSDESGAGCNVAKFCFNCSKSNRVGALIGCDFCPLTFHMDCLDPPLVIAPMGRWQCPNHVEAYVDGHLLSSHSYTERVKMWQLSSGHVDEHKIKLDFLRNVHRKAPTSTFKRSRVLKKRVKVPAAIVESYENPISLDANKENAAQLQQSPVDHVTPVSDVEKEQFLSAIQALTSGLHNSDIPTPNTVHKNNALEKPTGAQSNQSRNTGLCDSSSLLQQKGQHVGDTTKDKTGGNVTEDCHSKHDNSHHQKLIGDVPDIAVRALLCPLVCCPWQQEDIESKTVAMRLRTLRIGQGSNNEVDLNNFGHCNFVSGDHAMITYDEGTANFELVNYSRYGSMVDEVYYGVDFCSKIAPKEPFTEAIQQAKLLIRSSNRPAAQSILPTINCNAGRTLHRCKCRNRKELKADRRSAWEGPAILHHGSVLKFGCLGFVLSIVEDAVYGNWLNDTATLYEHLLRKEQESSDQSESRSSANNFL